MKFLKPSYTGLAEEPYLEWTDFGRSPIHRNRLAVIIDLARQVAPQPASAKLMEIGCGLGNIARPLASLGYQVTATDIHEPSVVLARQRNSFPNLTFSVGDPTTGDLRSYDILVLTEVLEHVSAYRDLLQRIARGMRPGAALILTVPNGWSPTECLCRPSYAMKKYRAGVAFVHAVKRMLGTEDVTTANEQTPHVNFFTRHRLMHLFAECGLRPEAMVPQFWLWPLYETFFSRHTLPDGLAGFDFRLAQRLPVAWTSFWAFLLIKQPDTKP